MSQDRFQKIDLLGTGGFGEVWLAEDREEGGLRVALKEIQKESAAEFVSLRREFGTLTRLNHPNLVKVFHFDQDPKTAQPRYSMEVVEGLPFNEGIKKWGTSVLFSGVSEALRALAFLHDFKVLHCDLKPGNLMIRTRPVMGARVVLLDFGLAHDRSLSLAKKQEEKTPTSGTLPYLAPENFEGHPPTIRSDLYALGVVVYEAIYGEHPIRFSENEFHQFVQQVRGGITSIPPLPKGLPEGIRDWLKTMLANDPAERFSSASEAFGGWNRATGQNFPLTTAEDRAARITSGEPPGFEERCDQLRTWLEDDGPRVGFFVGSAGMGKRRLMNWWHAEVLSHGWNAKWIRPGSVERVLAENTSEEPFALFSESGESLKDSDWQALRKAWSLGGDQIRLFTVYESQYAAKQKSTTLPAKAGWTLEIKFWSMDYNRVRRVARRALGKQGVLEEQVQSLWESTGGHPALIEALIIGGSQGDPLDKEKSAPPIFQAFEAMRASLSQEALQVFEWLALQELGATQEILEACQVTENVSSSLKELEAFGLVARRSGVIWFVPSKSLRRIIAVQLPYDNRVKRALKLWRVWEQEQAFASENALLKAQFARLAGLNEQARSLALSYVSDANRNLELNASTKAISWAIRYLGRNDPKIEELRLLQAAQFRQINRMRDAALCYRRLLNKAKNFESKALLLAHLAEIHAYSGKFAECEDCYRSALNLEQENLEVQGRAKRAAGICLARQGHYEQAEREFLSATEIFEAWGDIYELALTYQQVGLMYTSYDQRKATPLLQKAIDGFLEIDREDRTIMALQTIASLAMRNAKYENAVPLLDESLKLCELYGNVSRAIIGRGWLARIQLERNELAKTIATVSMMEEASRTLDDWRLVCFARNIMVRTYISAGQFHKALEVAKGSLDGPMDRVDAWIQGETKLVLLMAEAKLAGGWSERAIEKLEGLSSLDGVDADFLLAWSIAWLEANAAKDPEQALSMYEEAKAKAKTDHAWNQPVQLLEMELVLIQSFIELQDWERVNPILQAATTHAAALDLVAVKAKLAAYKVEIAEASNDHAEAARQRRIGNDLLVRAKALVGDEYLAEGFSDLKVFAPLRRKDAFGSTADERLIAMYRMIRAVNIEKDQEKMLATILDHAIEVVKAERGLIFLKHPMTKEFQVHVARNVEKQTIDDAAEYSRKIIQEAGAGQSMLSLDATNDERFKTAASVSLFGICSLMCVPLKTQNEIIGTVYLDDRRPGHIFSEDDLRFLEAFADHASIALRNVAERSKLIEENEWLKKQVESRDSFEGLIGASPAMQEVFNLLERVADSDLSVLIVGETGTGKELVARAIHARSSRNANRFLPQNCAAFSESLLSSQLFGHVKGAFTDAKEDRPGLFELANHGTLFLDEIGDMPLPMQASLLRVLQEKEVRRLGGSKTIQVDVRTLTATHRNLQHEVSSGRFRGDLLYRLQEMVIHLPPLRDRPGDIPLLVDHFINKMSKQTGRDPVPITANAMSSLEARSWPGNVRQLENSVRRLCVLAGDKKIDQKLVNQDNTLSAQTGTLGVMQGFTPPEDSQLYDEAAPAVQRKDKQNERLVLLDALQRAKNNRSKAARLMGVSRATFYRKLEKYGIS